MQKPRLPAGRGGMVSNNLKIHQLLYCIDMFGHKWYKLVMLLPKTYTPEQVAEILQLSKNTIYDLISRGEIIAKKIGKVYRIPAASLSFVFTGLDEDLQRAEK